MTAKKTTLLLVGALCLVACATSPPADSGSGLVASLDVTYMTRLMDKGGEYYGDDGAVLESLDVTHESTGIGVNVAHRWGLASEHDANTRLDYTLHFGTALFEEESYALDLGLGATYHHHPRGDRDDSEEYQLRLAAPSVLPGGVVPHVVVAHEDPGWWYAFGLGYDLRVEGLDSPLSFSLETAYRNPWGGVDDEWTHVTLGVTTAFELLEGLSIHPGVFYQISLEDAVAEDDVGYAALSVKYSF